VAGGASRVRLDLNSPEFRDVFFRLEAAELKQVVASLRRLRELDWTGLYRHTGFRWEAIEHLTAPNGASVYSLRLSQKVRAVAYRDGDFLRLISLHPDHDSAYERRQTARPPRPAARPCDPARGPRGRVR
jgi:hypothetical protein